MSDTAFKKILAVLIAVLTVITAVVAFLQSNAGNRDDQAGRDATRLAVELVGRRIQGEARVNFDFDEAYQKYIEMGALSRAAENRGDEASAERYALVQQSFLRLSPIMQEPYFDAETGSVDFSRYTADVYLTEVTRMKEQYTAAAAVKDAWDTKANTYIVHLTILAVALFLLGLSATIEVRAPRMIFTVAGMAMAVVAVAWALSTFMEPVFDLREQPDAIEGYVTGTILASEGQPEAALEAFNTAIAAVPDYASAYVGRSGVYLALDDNEKSIADLKQARALGLETASVIGEQAWQEYLGGKYDDSIATGRTALELYPDSQELWIRFDLALALMANGQIDAGKAEFENGMNAASESVALAKSRGEPLSSLLWWSLIGAADDLDNLTTIARTGEGTPPADTLKDKEGIIAASDDLVDRLRSLSVSLEFYGAPPSGPLEAEITGLEFAEPLYSDDNSFLEHDVAEEFDYGVNEMDAMFDFTGMKDGQELLVKVYINGEEDASWRKAIKWEAGEEGAYILPLAVAYSDTFVLSPGSYFVEIYVDGQIAAEGGFSVNEPE